MRKKEANTPNGFLSGIDPHVINTKIGMSEVDTNIASVKKLLPLYKVILKIIIAQWMRANCNVYYW